MPDRITVSGLTCHLAHGVGPSAFGLSPPPPAAVILDVDIDLHPHIVPASVHEDDMPTLGVNYSSVSKAIYALVSDASRTWARPAELLDAAAAVPLALPAVAGVTVRATLPRALLHAQAAEYARSYSKAMASAGDVECTIRDLRVATVIGLHPHERSERQRLETDVQVSGVGEQAWAHKDVADASVDFFEKSSFGTLESLVDTFARHLLSLRAVSGSGVDITIRKPSALPFATPVIRVSRRAADYNGRGGLSTAGVRMFGTLAPPAAPSQATTASSSSTSGDERRVFIAVGSNIGDRVGHIRKAIRLLEPHCKLVSTSRLYESEPMYVTEQDIFTNGVIEVSTSLAPLDLLRLLKQTETEVGRVKTFTNGPRVIDLDLVLYGDETVKIGAKGDAADKDGVAWLEVPHASVKDREFVLRPLADIAPDLYHPALGATVSELLSAVAPGGLAPIIPFPAPAQPLRLAPTGSPATPAIMAIFNATPDSFSDGHADRTDTLAALEVVNTLASTRTPPAIIDIGGMSTRPNSLPCTEEEELARVVPLVQAIRIDDTPASTLPLSIDTYRASVAAASIAAGASCINDVRGGAEPGMLSAMAAADCPVVIMHSRGDSVSMATAEEQVYPAGVVAGVRSELSARVRAALDAGVKRWDIVLDPGLGFAKSQAQNLELLKHIDELATGELAGYPVLVGGSRKGFVGRATGQTVARERGPGDAAVNAWCVQAGVVDVLRVHDAQLGAESVAMAAAIRDA